MKRRLFTLASAMSLLLCVGASVLWVRSLWFDDALVFTTQGRLWCFTSSHGNLAVSRIDGWPNPEPLRWFTPADGPPVDQDDAEWWATRRAAGAGFRTEFFHTYLTPAGHPDWTFWSTLNSYTPSRRFEGVPRTPALCDVSFVLPLPALLLLFFVIPGMRAVIAAYRRIAQRTKRTLGVCLSCGYDLRATPEDQSRYPLNYAGRFGADRGH